ncbi:putative RNA-binding protein 19 [Sciurus carolinensis]|uniref:RNA-binding protein 19 n=1 Tax=Sciurus carolinensis TaxID=30640 RepID=A0AA41MCD4_SCICA|nr:putative RNA-binding protein 19 [Sciurus carolinensis]
MGFKSEEEAQTSLSHFNKSFIDSSWITNDNKGKVPSELEKLKEGSEFQEFLSVHQKWTQVVTWTNDALDTDPLIGKSKLTSDYLNFDSDSGQESEEEAAEDPAVEQGLEPNMAAQKGLSDMEYLKSKMVTAESSSEEESEDEAVNCDEGNGHYIEVFREKHVPTAKGPLQNSPLSELHYPIDSLTKEPKGFVFVTFMFPEHALKAYVAVDVQVFQGRMLHVLPSTIRQEVSEDVDTPGSSYKKALG